MTTGTFSIREASVTDIATIRTLALEVWPVTFGEILSAEQIAYMLEMMYSEASLRNQFEVLGHRYLLGSLDGRPVAYCGYQHDYLPRATKIHKLYVLPELQGEGLGRKLIAAVAERAMRHNQVKIRLDVNYQNSAIGFYERMGFVKVDEITTDIGEGFLMEDYVYEIGLT